MIRFVILSFFTTILSSLSPAQTPSRFDYWKIGAHFRGFDIVADEYQKSLANILTLQQSGATILHIGTKGFQDVDAPYSPVDSNIGFLDHMISLCHDAKLHYSLTVRQGPGRRDVYLESIGEPLSTIWIDTAQEQQYASMLRKIVDRYKDDSLFIGIAPITEPNPLSKNNFYVDTATLNKLLIANKIDLHHIMQLCVDSIRSVSKDIPILIQGPAFASPEFIPLAPKINDPFIVYEFHCYRPHEFVFAPDTSTLTYPGYYISYIEKKLGVLHNKEYLKDSVCKYIYDRQKETGAPIFMGEFGVQWPHSDGEHLLEDLSSIAIENGWHFAYWAYDGVHHRWGWDYEVMPGIYWQTVQRSFEGNSSVRFSAVSNPKLTLSPNPSTDYVTLKVETSEDFRAISLYDVLGHFLRQIPIRNIATEIIVEDLAPGEYQLILQGKKGIVQKRFIVAR